jgi:hypothetical protein
MSFGWFLFLALLVAIFFVVRRSRRRTEHPEQALPTGVWIELRDGAGEPLGALIPTDLSSAEEARDRLERRQAGLADVEPCTRLSRGIAHALSTAFPNGDAAVTRDLAFQVVGPGEVVQILGRGELRLVRSSDGSVDVVSEDVEASEKGAVGLRRGGVAKVPFPSVFNSSLAAVAEIVELRRVNERLDSILRTLRQVHPSEEEWQADQVGAASSVLGDIVEEHRHTGRITPEMMSRLGSVELIVQANRSRIHPILGEFRRLTRQVESLKGEAGARMLMELLVEEGPRARLRMKELVSLVAADLKIQELLLRYTLEHAPGDLDRRLALAGERIKEYSRLDPELPTLDSLRNGARRYARGTGWWSRDVLGWQARLAMAVPRKDPSDGEGHPPDVPLVGFLVWRDFRGELEALALPEDQMRTQPLSRNGSRRPGALGPDGAPAQATRSGASARSRWRRAAGMAGKLQGKG